MLTENRSYIVMSYDMLTENRSYKTMTC